MHKTSPTNTSRHLQLKTGFRRTILVLALTLILVGPKGSLWANPYGTCNTYSCRGGREYYQPSAHNQCSGWAGNGNSGGWIGTGIPNGLGWALFGIAAASSISRSSYVNTAPVVVHQPVYIKQSMVRACPAVIYTPMVNYSGIPSYYMNGN